MKKIRLGILTFVFAIMFSICSFAGEWKQDDKGYWYQEEDGSFKVGWYQDVDGKWYYFDYQSGYMLTSTTTPDGYNVNENGEWIEMNDGVMAYDGISYDNKVEFEVSAYSNSPAPVEKFGHPLPVTVYYDNEYISGTGRKITITDLSVSKDGILYVEYEMGEPMFYYELSMVTRYMSENGEYVDVKDRTSNFYGNGNDSKDYCPVMGSPYKVKGELISAEVYIDMGNTD